MRPWLAALFVLLLAPAARAGKHGDGYDVTERDATVGDYNVGGGAVGQRPLLAGLGALGNAELVHVGRTHWEHDHLRFFDLRLLTFIGAGLPLSSEPAPRFLFRLSGSVAGGFMAFRAVPFNLAFEDLEFAIDGSALSWHGLGGVSAVLPRWSVEKGILAATLTAGRRVRSAEPATSSAIQLKLRWIHDRASAELRGLTTLDAARPERRAVLVLAQNHLFGDGTQLGAWAEVTSLGGAVSGQVVLFAGGNL